ncbi:MAG: RagB/SusD family nutrient uptake outer membrane protein [Bacteroidales bacterium]|nr:RagB/SusD family nutrient uptake outer membrane protein [Bacteroidales bacterium]MDD2426205.1 RagB/SusD family nutrient uptake outer membrane protein [Bacteroidales bacterium]MDD3990359.1 RagB/SusD family nutrient uptake outer membrane protein [Bacteroidales bacterium]MDD4638646.1 RagB/SusD family nutrient uptake outer membrane protein [Bacteroidales bacterium]
MKKIISALILTGLMFLNSCSKDFLDTKSTSAVDQTTIFENTNNAMMAINGIHRVMYEKGNYAPKMGYMYYMLYMDFLGEDLVYTKSNTQFKTETAWTRHREPANQYPRHIYEFIYRVISNSNMVIENIDDAEGPQEERDYIKGQALFYRGFAHFLAVQLYGQRYDRAGNNTQDGIVLRTSSATDPQPRSSVEDVYTSVNEDLDDAIELLSGVTIERTTKMHINVHVARAIKARVLLTQGKWIEAAQMAKLVVDHSGAEMDNSCYEFKQGRCCDASNKEWIWAKIAQPDIETATLFNFYSYISNTNISYNKNTPRAIYNLLYEKISDTDIRKQLWVADVTKCPNLVYPPGGNRYKWMSQKFIVDYPDNTSASYSGAIITADLAFVRLPEMYLVMAEGYARGGQENDARNALYVVAHDRDPQYTMSTNSGTALIDEIMFQRRVELWGEGFRWLDLKRLNLPLDRGPAPRPGYNQGGAVNNWKSNKNPTNLDPLASNFNMYEEQPVGELSRYMEAGIKEWQWVIPQLELDYNPLCNQNPL